MGIPGGYQPMNQFNMDGGHRPKSVGGLIPGSA